MRCSEGLLRRRQEVGWTGGSKPHRGFEEPNCRVCVALFVPARARLLAGEGAVAIWSPLQCLGVDPVGGPVLPPPLMHLGQPDAGHSDLRGIITGDAAVHRKTGDQTGQESRSAGHGAAPSLTAMDITIHYAFLPHTDPDAALAFYRDTLGFEVRNDVG